MMPSSGSTRLSIDQWSSGFDGVEQYDREISKNQVILGETNSGARQWTPRSLIWEGGDELIEIAGKTRSGQVPDRDRAASRRRLEMLRGQERQARRQWGAEYIISPKQGYLTDQQGSVSIRQEVRLL